MRKYLVRGKSGSLEVRSLILSSIFIIVFIFVSFSVIGHFVKKARMGQKEVIFVRKPDTAGTVPEQVQQGGYGGDLVEAGGIENAVIARLGVSKDIAIVGEGFDT